MRSALTGIVPSSFFLQRLALRALPVLVIATAACASTENPQPVLVINGGAGGTGGTSGGAGGSTAGVGGSGSSGGTTGGTGAAGGSDVGGSAGMASGGVGGAGGSAGTAGGSAGTGGMGGTAGSAGTSAGTGGMGGAAGSGAGGSAGSTTGGTGGGGAVNLYFSEYMEDGQNKGVEIYNAGPALNISQCVLRVYFNGSSTPNPDIPLDSKTLATGQVHTVCGSSTAAGGVCQQIASNKMNPSGNDAVELACNGVTLDLIGKIGVDPGSGWSGGGISTNDQTLWRKCSVTSGNPNGFTDPSIEWQAPTGGAGLDFSNFGMTSCP
ncbi:MAG: hypothetical protein R3B07_17250 [Polyangiaceae bacterium]